MRTASDATGGLATSDADATRLRLGLEGSWTLPLEGEGMLMPRLALGLRHDGGDAETGFGVEIGGGMAWTDPGRGLSLDMEGRTLVLHEAGGLKDWGLSVSLSYDPVPSSVRGLSISLRQGAGGSASGGVDALFAPDPLAGRADSDAEARWTIDAAYGLPALGGRFTGSPHAGIDLAGDEREYRVGWKLAPESRLAPDLTLGVMAERSVGDATAPGHRFGIELEAKW